jgi:quercetin dioxygenase-like cupin family protein
MEKASIEELELEPAWSEDDPTLRTADGYLLHWQQGATASSVVLFDVEPGCHIGRHRHTAEEVVLVLEGEVEVEVDGERVTLRAGELGFAPAHVPHNVHCKSPERARCVGFFAAAAVVSTYEDVVMPAETRVRGTPVPDE